ncbi:MAG: phosphotransacetylase family protein [Chloroflexi bacterium]|nr:phosphotransacetylase family protein [Chloroflexota bacterium]MCL5074800.1 phosphotransacetylase family protein [Chloroflexota bacterium]
MATLYLTSLEPYSGKSALCVGLALELKSQGLSIAYMKPLGASPTEVRGCLTDEDAVFIQRTLELDEPLEVICPLLLTPELMAQPLREPVRDKERQLLDIHDRLAASHNVVIMEGPRSLATGWAIGIPPAYLAKVTRAKMIIVIRYEPDLSIDDLLMAKEAVGDHLSGVIVNSVPTEMMSYVKQSLAPFLARHQMRLFGALPLDKLLMAITVRELANLLNAEILCSADKQEELVENFSIGAMNVDSALKYFLRTPDKAVITGGDRADIQLAALQTSTKCLILTGNLYPDAIILGRAAELGVPMLLVRTDTMRTVEIVERALGHIRLSSPRQIDRLTSMIRSEIDLAGLRQILEK